MKFGLSLWSVLVALLLLGGAMSKASPPSRPVVLIAVIGSPAANGSQPDENNPSDGSEGNQPYTSDGIGQATEERREEYQDQGFDVELRHFQSLTAYLCWLCQHAPNSFAHVEMYGHGCAAGP